MPAPDHSMIADLFSLTGKVALVTGAAGHLGSAIAQALALAGATVYLNGRNRDRLEDLRKRLAGHGGEVFVAAFDILDIAAMQTAIARIGDERGRLDVLVNNAYSGKTGTIDSATWDDFSGAFAAAVAGPAMLLKEATPLLSAFSKRDDTASVINIASMYGSVSPDPSIYGDTGHNSPPHYAAAKGGLLQFTRYAAVHLAERNIRVNAISPGAFPKPAVADKMPELWKLLNSKQPMRRVGMPQELQGAVLFLASRASSYVTGINVPVDGGWTAW